VVISAFDMACSPWWQQSSLPEGLFAAFWAGNPWVGGWRKVGLELLGIIVPFPGVLTNKGGFRRCDHCESDPCRAGACGSPFLRDFWQGPDDGSWERVLLCWACPGRQSNCFMRFFLLPDSVCLERNVQLPSSEPACQGAGTPSTEQASKKSTKSRSDWLRITAEGWQCPFQPLPSARRTRHALAGSCGPVKTWSEG